MIRTETMLRESGVDHTFLRPSFYLDHVALWADDHGVIRGPAEDGRIAWVARDDLAAVAAQVLTSGGHEGATYDVTGDELLTMAETAARLGGTGGGYRFENETVDEAYASRRAAYPRPPTGSWTDGSAPTLRSRGGEMAVASDVVEQFTGRAPRRLVATAV